MIGSLTQSSRTGSMITLHASAEHQTYERNHTNHMRVGDNIREREREREERRMTETLRISQEKKDHYDYGPPMDRPITPYGPPMVPLWTALWSPYGPPIYQNTTPELSGGQLRSRDTIYKSDHCILCDDTPTLAPSHTSPSLAHRASSHTSSDSSQLVLPPFIKIYWTPSGPPLWQA